MSSEKQPIQIPAHVATFGLLMLPAVLCTLYADRFGPSDEVLGEEIKERYSSQVSASTKKNKDMEVFFQRAIRGNKETAEVDDQLDEMLKAGKGGKKRMFHVDKSLYGTRKGAEERKRREENEHEKKKKKEETKQPEKTLKTEVEGKDNSSPTMDTNSIAGLVVVTTVAAAAGFLAGGANRR